ncbi:type 1 glutamine amidotransferase domain-containing protein [Roseisolibacter sp. H3M3-2]|uniref:type 1 glutamine amidotransferase domain-containing protein n=1 Tax=Roseisolibacter sp. H3M3-2 TaxID=3031323 RepID=UPI0023DB4390|nr:type 1 glutamine amidotransferase domain-containing protein [Roseisolibacter sp. H3M3-2]MDF1502419.1 type 1 glutamine amidotransferase [Roseisolibacter sp. H3M3-2]
MPPSRDAPPPTQTTPPQDSQEGYEMFDSQELDGVRIAVLAADGVEQVEVTRPVRALERHGAEIEIVSLRPGSIRAMNLLYPGKKLRVDRTVVTADPERYDGLHIPGGFINPDFVRQSEHALEFVQALEADGKPISTICHGPWVLVSAGLVRGRRLTSWPGIKDDVRNAGGVWVDSEVVRDGNWVSSRGPQDLHAFDKAIVEHFARRAGRSGHATRAVSGDGSWQRFLAGGVAAATVGYVARQAWRGR